MATSGRIIRGRIFLRPHLGSTRDSYRSNVASGHLVREDQCGDSAAKMREVLKPEIFHCAF